MGIGIYRARALDLSKRRRDLSALRFVDEGVLYIYLYTKRPSLRERRLSFFLLYTSADVYSIYTLVCVSCDDDDDCVCVERKRYI